MEWNRTGYALERFCCMESIESIVLSTIYNPHLPSFELQSQFRFQSPIPPLIQSFNSSLTQHTHSFTHHSTHYTTQSWRFFRPPLFICLSVCSLSVCCISPLNLKLTSTSTSTNLHTHPSKQTLLFPPPNSSLPFLGFPLHSFLPLHPSFPPFNPSSHHSTRQRHKSRRRKM